jgi:molybdenum cofactor cytidylyltransferase
MIAAILLAAGESKRMGTPKMLLPWGNRTVIEHVVSTFLKAGIEEILVVTGGAREQVEQALETYPVRKLHNPKYATGEMLLSLQRGIRAMPARTEA